MKNPRLIAAVAAALALAGCASTGPSGHACGRGARPVACPAAPQRHTRRPHRMVAAVRRSPAGRADRIGADGQSHGGLGRVAHPPGPRHPHRGGRCSCCPRSTRSASAARGNNQPPVPLATTMQVGLQAAWEIDLFGGNRAGGAKPPRSGSTARRPAGTRRGSRSRRKPRTATSACAPASSSWWSWPTTTPSRAPKPRAWPN